VIALLVALVALQAPPPPVDLDAARAARLEAQRQQAIARHDAIVASGMEERFTAALEQVIAANPGDVESLPYVEVKDGKVPLGAFTSFVRWQACEAEGRPQVAIDRAIANAPLDTIVDFERQLAARGVALLVVLLPTRLEIQPELVVDAATEKSEKPAKPAKFAGLGSATQLFVAELAKEGVEAVSLLDAFVAHRATAPAVDSLFLRSDPHLTPRGYEIAARVAAERLLARPDFARGSLAEGRDFVVVPADFAYDPSETALKRGSEKEAVRGSTLRLGTTIVDLHDETAPLVVLGDSHTRLHSFTGCDFVAQLGRFTGQKVDYLKADGGAPDQVRRKLARREPERWKSMKTVVWLLSETVLVPSTRWKKIALGEQE
jgi:hypothetical protein